MEEHVERPQTDEAPLVDAGVCAAANGIPKATFYKMVQANRIPAYRVGAKGRGLRFSIPEVRQALRKS